MLPNIGKKFDKKSGGIVIIFKIKLKHCLSFPKTKSDYVLWVKIRFINCINPTLLGCVYIFPQKILGTLLLTLLKR